MSHAVLEDDSPWLDTPSVDVCHSVMACCDDSISKTSNLFEKMRGIPEFVDKLFQTLDDEPSKLERLVQFLEKKDITVAELKLAIQRHVLLLLIASTAHDPSQQMYLVRLAEMLDYLELLAPEDAAPIRLLLNNVFTEALLKRKAP